MEDLNIKHYKLTCKKRLIAKTLLASTMLSLATYNLTATAQNTVVAKVQPRHTLQDLQQIKDAAHSFLLQQVNGMPGRTKVKVGAVDPNIRLSKCNQLEAFLPQGSRAWGKTNVGVKCNGNARWTIYVQANVDVHGQYIVAAAPLARGTVVSADDLSFVVGDLTKLPAGIFSSAEQAVGRVVTRNVAAGAFLRQNFLKEAPVVQRGQTVMLTSSGKGFKVAAEGKALANAIEGQVVQVKVSSGQVVAGIAKAGGQIEVKF